MGPRERAPRRRSHHPHRASLIIVSRFQGNERDGHGNHQTAGLLTQHAFEAAADPKMFPDQIQAGLRPWRASEAVHRRHARGRGLDGPRGHRPVQPLARRLVRQLRAHRPRLPAIAERRTGDAVVGGQLRLLQAHGHVGPPLARRNRISSPASTRSIPGLFKALGRPEPAGAAALLQPIDAAVQEAMRTFDGRDPSAIVPVLARGLAAARVAAAKLQADADAALILDRKDRAVSDGHQHGARARPHGGGTAGGCQALE